MKRFIIIWLLLMIPLSSIAKSFTRDYTYRAGDDDSKNTARSKAIEQVKLILLEEIGVYIQSYVEIEKTTKNKSSSSFLSHEINTTTAGITKTQILTENWDGKEYRLRARINIDVEDVIKKINETIKTRANSKNIAEYNRLLKLKNTEITTLSTSLKKKKQQTIKQQLKIDKLNIELSQLKIKLQKQLKQEQHIANVLEKIKSRIENSTEAAYKFSPGMTKNELQKIAGRASAEDTCNSNSYLSYGRYWAYMQGGIFRELINITEYRGPCNTRL